LNRGFRKKKMDRARKFLPPKNVNVVVHHSPCNDGHASAAIVYHEISEDIIFIGIHPKDELLTDYVSQVITGRNVLMIDIAFSPETIEKASKLVNSLLIIDHHVTNETTLKELSIQNVHTVFVMGEAGVQLTWKYVHGDEKPIPRSLEYIGLKDVWKHEDNESALYFTTAFERPQTLSDWYPVIGDVCTDQTIEKGRIIYDYQRSVLKTMMEKVGYTNWRGYRMAIVNVPFPWISDIGAMMCEEDPENTIAVIWNKPVYGGYSVSLRTHNPLGPNVEAIAREFKGGGHVHGAGLRLDDLPYKIFSE